MPAGNTVDLGPTGGGKSLEEVLYQLSLTAQQGAGAGDGGSATPFGGGASTSAADYAKQVLQQWSEYEDRYQFYQAPVADVMEYEMETWLKQHNLNPIFASQWLDRNQSGLNHYLDPIVRMDVIDPQNPEPGFQVILELARRWIESHSELFKGFADATLSNQARSGGGGRRGPTAAEIRQSFDMNQLTDRVRQLWRAYLVEEPSKPFDVAKSYVDSIVRNPEQKVDFDTYVKSIMFGTSMGKRLYKNKPAGMTEEDYMAPYAAIASQVLGGSQGTTYRDTVQGGMALASDPNAYRARLDRTDAVMNSTPFFNKLGQRISGLRDIFK
jgi:hypothetical protein